MLQIDPNNAAAHWGLAKGYLANQQLQEGFWELRETVRLDPENNAAREQLSQLLLLGGDPDEALAQAEELIEPRRGARASPPRTKPSIDSIEPMRRSRNTNWPLRRCRTRAHRSRSTRRP